MYCFDSGLAFHGRSIARAAMRQYAVPSSELVASHSRPVVGRMEWVR
jgi:hypothetical protein